MAVETQLAHAGLAISVAAAVAGCWRYDELYCEKDGDCLDVTGRHYCDLTGEHPLSDGIARTCVPDPAVLPAGALTLRPETPTEDVAVGESAVVRLEVIMTELVRGDVVLAAVSPPEGLLVDEVMLAASQTSGQLIVRTTAGATPGRVSLTFQASARNATARASVDLSVRGTPGSRDLTFGVDGVARANVPRQAHRSNDVIAAFSQGDKIVFVLRSMTLGRIAENGVLDSTFGTGSKIVAASITGDGSIFVAGNGILGGQEEATEGFLAYLSPDGHLNLSVGLRRLNDDAAPDDVCAAFSTSEDEMWVLGRPTPDGGLRVWRSKYHGRFFLYAFPTITSCVASRQDDGALLLLEERATVRVRDPFRGFDASFGVGGRLTLPPGDATWTHWFTFPEGRAMAVSGNHTSPVFWRVDAHGRLDVTFGTGGYFSESGFFDHQAFLAIGLLPDGASFAVANTNSHVDPTLTSQDAS